MKIALLNAFPNLSHSAEREFIERCLAVLAAQGVEAQTVLTSDEIIAFEPDVVIVTHEFVGKTTDHFTVGLLWSPTRFYREEPERLKAIRSWDLVVPIHAATRRFARNLHFPLRHESAVSGLDFMPSAPDAPLAMPDSAQLGLAYVGAHWDGQRHRPLLEELARVTDLHIYGPASAWTFLPSHYRGAIPFDGRSLVQTLNRHGVVLALHKLEHVEEQTPSMRVFEACAARCVVITEPMQPLVERFGDALHYLDTSQSPRQQAQRIAEIVEGYRADPVARARQVTRAHQVFSEGLSLERLLGALLEDVAARRVTAWSPEPLTQAPPVVSIIVRCGSRPLALVQRAVASLARQSYPHLRLMFVRFAPIEGFDAWVDSLREGGRFREIDIVEAPGGGVRSAAMWVGLRRVQTELFGMLDDDDELFVDHVASLVTLLGQDPDCDVAYSGVVKQEEDGPYLNTHARFKGDLGKIIPERRELKFMDDFSLDRLMRFDNFIQSNTWLARSRVLLPEVLDDPELEVGEDLYFYLLLSSRFRFRFTGRVTAVWNWRSNAADNSMLAVSQARWERCGAEVIRRLSALEFPGAWLGREVLGKGRGMLASHGVSDDSSRPRVTVAGASSRPREWLKRVLSLASGGRAFVPASQPIPFDPADVVCSIDFTQRHWPEWLVNARGLSDIEPWGCWTDGPLVKLDFRQPLPARFIVHLIGHAHASQHRRPLVLAVGSNEATLRMSARWRACRYTVTLDNSERERSLLLRIPDVQSPAAAGTDARETRRLGIGLVRLDIVSA